MRTIIQRVSQSEVVIESITYSSIQRGVLILIGISHEDTYEDILWLTQKILNLRIFNDEQGKMNLSLQDIQGELLIVSQFTLFASTKKGNRPSFINSASPKIAIPLYNNFVSTLQQSNLIVKTGIFGADMKVSLVNDGPVTIYLDSKNKE
jgi:D-aminoacyl-tRNA deacylase